MTEKQFELKSFNYQNQNIIIYDNLSQKDLILSVYGLVDLLNKVSQSKYDLLKLRKDIRNDMETLMNKWKE